MRFALSFAFDGAECLRIARELERTRLVCGQRRRDQFGHADRREQARRNSSCEGRARRGDDRHAHEQRIARRGVRVAGQRVEEQVRESEPREMIVEVGKERREHQATRADALFLSFDHEVAARGVVGLGEPQHAAVDGLEQPHPHREDLRCEFVAVVEAAEDDARFRQARFRAAERPIGHSPSCVAGHVRVGQIDNLLAVVTLLSLGDHDRIGEDVVDVGRGHCAGKAEIVHLHRRRPEREDALARIAGQAHQVDGDVDLSRLHQACDFEIGPAPHVKEAARRISSRAS